MTIQDDLAELKKLLNESTLLRLETDIVEDTILLREVVVRLPNGQMIAFCQDSDYNADYFMCKWCEYEDAEMGEYLFVPVKDIKKVLKRAENL
jgi:hypothetical protein